MHEPQDISLRGVRRGALAIAGGIAFALAAAGLAWRLLQAAPGPGFAGTPPLLQPAPQSERAAYFAGKEAIVNGYGWVDRRSGIARIPVDQAMALMAARARTAREPR
jgi:hypothetical protein